MAMPSKYVAVESLAIGDRVMIRRVIDRPMRARAVTVTAIVQSDDGTYRIDYITEEGERSYCRGAATMELASAASVSDVRRVGR